MKPAQPISTTNWQDLTDKEMPPAMGRLIRVVGHDLRNKLTVMKNSLYYLNMKLGHGDEKVQKHFRIMGREVANANRIISDLMDFALTKEPTLRQSDVKAIVAEALSQASLPDHWEAAIHLEDGCPLLMADADQLQRAFTNIILRVVEGVPEGGKLQIIASKQGDFVEIGFGAAGLIILEESLAEIFNPLLSTGVINLKMAVSKRLVENHGGTIGVRSLAGPFDNPSTGLRTGKGTMFTVRLPLLGKGGAKRREKASILIVDDDVSMSETLSDILEAKGYRVVVAPDGPKAIAEVKGQHFDLALIDIVMPTMNGIETLRRIKAVDPHIIAMIMTGYEGLDVFVPDDPEAGVDGILSKPFEIEAIVEMLNS